MIVLDKQLAINMSEEISVDGKTEVLAHHEYMLETMNKLRPHHLLSFATGATSQPGSGWPSKPGIEFDHAANQMSFPRSNTCGLTLTIPVSETNANLLGFFFTMAYSLCHGGMFSAA